MPYKLHIQYDHARLYVINLRCKVEWAHVVNRKTYNSRTGELIEDLDIYPDIPKKYVEEDFT